MSEITPIDAATIGLLADFLRRFESEDAYAVSPGYYLITGRKGLWLYRRGDAGLVIARHPNLDDTLLIFPPFPEDAALLAEAVRDRRFPEKHRHLARLPERRAAALTGDLGAPHAETVLD